MKFLQLVAVLGVLVFGASAAADDVPPNVVIQEAVDAFAAQMQGRADEFVDDRSGLYQLIDDILLPRFDRKFSAQVVLAKHWRTASAEQRERFIEAFYQALVRRYAEGLLEFEQEMVEILPFRGDANKPRTKVRSTVRLTDGTKVKVDYELVKRESGWRLFNVVIEGVSYVRNFRTELDAEIRDSNLDTVIARLEREAGIASGE